MEKEKNGGLLGLLARERMETELEEELRSNQEYQQALKGQDDAVRRMDALRPGRKWERAADRAVSAANHCGAVYGTAAYRLGFRDGIRMAYELKGIA